MKIKMRIKWYFFMSVKNKYKKYKLKYEKIKVQIK